MLQEWIQQKYRKRGHVCPSLCLLMWGKKPDEEHADPQSWLQSSPGKSVLHYPVSQGCLRWSSNQDNNRAWRQKWLSTNKLTNGLMHDMRRETDVFAWRWFSANITCAYVYSVHSIHVSFLTVCFRSSFCASAFWRLHYWSVYKAMLCCCSWVKARGGNEQCRGKHFCGTHWKGLHTYEGGYMHICSNTSTHISKSKAVLQRCRRTRKKRWAQTTSVNPQLSDQPDVYTLTHVYIRYIIVWGHRNTKSPH